MISAINYSVQVSELIGIINLVDQGQSSLSHSEHGAKLMTHSTIDMLWQNF